MNSNQWEDLDEIMRLLYRNRQGMAWYDVYTQLNFERDYAQDLYDVAEAHGYLTVDHKGFDTSHSDRHYVKLTSAGIIFFAKTNFVEDNTAGKPYLSSTVHNNIYHSSGVNISNEINSPKEPSKNTEEKQKWWKNEWLVGIGTALIVALILYLIKNYLKIDL